MMTDWLHVRYRVRSDAALIEQRAAAIAIEQSVEMPPEAISSERIREHMVGRVESIKPDGPDQFEVTVRLSAETVDADPAQLLNMLFGNVSLQQDVELLDVELPPSVFAGCSGPHHGIAGVRQLAGATGRALTCSPLKPQGSTASELAELCRRLAVAGIDVIKDDHSLANQAAAPFAQRVAACQRAVERAAGESGHRSIYAPSIVATPRRAREQLRVAADHGVRAVLVAPMVVGLPAFAELTSDHPELVVLAHPAFAGCRISPVLLLARLFRLYGADALIFPHHGGRFAYSRRQCAALAATARAPWDGFRAALPVPAGGITLDRVDEVLDFYGTDVMLLVGGALLAAGDDLIEQARSFVARVRDRDEGPSR